MSKVLALGLQNSLVTSYDQTKTTLQGRVAQRIINDGNGNKTVIGANTVTFMDIFDDTGVAPAALHCTTINGRVFVCQGFVAGVLTIAYYSFDVNTGIASWQGSKKFAFTNTGAYTLRGFSVDDSNPSSMNLSWFVTNTTTQQGGWYADFGVNITSFVKVSIVTDPVASSGSQSNAVYQIGDATTQAAHTITVSDGGEIDSVGGFTYILNGVAATPKIFKFVNTVPTTVPVAGYSQANGTIVVTAVLPALAGTVLLLNCVKLGTPGSWSSNSGNLCLMFITSTTLYNAKVSDITNGATSLPSLMSGNMAGSSDYLIPTASFGQYSQSIDKFVIGTSLGSTLIKQGMNNDSNAKFMSAAGIYIKSETGGSITPVNFDFVTTTCLTMMNGWAVLMSTSIGQRGLAAIDIYSDESSVANASAPFPGQINTSIISPVVSGTFTQGLIMGIYYELAKRSVKLTVQYRVANFSTGPGAGFDATWTTIPKDGDLSTLVNATQVQFRFLFNTIGLETVNPPQLNEAYFIYNDATQISSNWEGSVDNTTSGGSSPTRSAFRLVKAYASVVPKLFYRAVDDSGNVIVLADTVTNAANFEYSTNNGTSWIPLGTIPNTILTTEVRYNHSSPPGVRITSSLGET